MFLGKNMMTHTREQQIKTRTFTGTVIIGCCAVFSAVETDTRFSAMYIVVGACRINLSTVFSEYIFLFVRFYDDIQQRSFRCTRRRDDPRERRPLIIVRDFQFTEK